MIQKTCNDSRTEHKSIFWQIYAAKVWAVLHADLSHCSSATIQFDARNLAIWVKLLSTCRFLKTSSLQYCTFSKLSTTAMLTINRCFASLWCNLGVIWANTKHLKSRTMAFASGSNQIWVGSFKKVLNTYLGQGTEKILEV